MDDQIFKCSLCQSTFIENHPIEECQATLLDEIDQLINKMTPYQLIKLLKLSKFIK